jgi:hypothetical protein
MYVTDLHETMHSDSLAESFNNIMQNSYRF